MPAEGSAVARTAVIVIGGGEIDPRVVAHLPADRMVIAADSGLDHAMELGLEVDLLVGDLDSVSQPALAEAIARGTPVERHRPDKDATDTELALAAAVERGCTHLIGVGGPRPDDSRDAKGVDSVLDKNPGPHAGEQLHIPGTHSADGVSGQQEEEADYSSKHAPAEPFPAEGGKGINPAADDERIGNPVGDLELKAVDDGGRVGNILFAEQMSRELTEQFGFVPKRKA
jgi:hypothetical protein